MKAYFADQFVLPLPPGHRFPMAKYRLLREWVASNLPEVTLLEAPPATDGQLALAHTPAYIDAIDTGTLDAIAQRELGFPWSPELVARSRRSVGATIAACQSALADGVAVNLAGGTHHASAAKGSGFCVFNDAAVAARLMQAQCATIKQVAIIDLDVHQGNGSAEIFSNDPHVFTLSIHGEKNFPFRKVASDLDVGLPDRCTDGPYLEALDAALTQLERRFAPDLIIYLAGADPHEGDRLGRLNLSFAGLRERDRRVLAWAGSARIPTALAMAGGYGHDLATTVQVQCNTIEAASAAQRAWAQWPARGLCLKSATPTRSV